MDSRLVLSVVLAGDNRLEKLLMRQEVEPVRRRLAHVVTLRLLSRDETRAYMEHRIAVAGGKDLPFDADAVDAVFDITRGNLRAVDHVAHKAMGYASEQGDATVDTRLVLKARQSLLM
jgi:MSHA biogenesis protein MshM